MVRALDDMVGQERSHRQIRALAGAPGGLQLVANQFADMCRAPAGGSLCWVVLPSRPSKAAADVLITRKNDSVASALYQRF